MTGVSYGIEIHSIAKDQYPRYRSPNGAEAFDKGRILGRYQSGMDQIKGTTRAKLGQSCFQCKRVASPWSRTSVVVAARGRGFVSSYLVAKALQGGATQAPQSVDSLQDAIDRLMRKVLEECKDCNDDLSRSFFEQVIPTLNSASPALRSTSPSMAFRATADVCAFAASVI